MELHRTLLLKAESCVVSMTHQARPYIPYADLTESDVLGWVYASLVEGEETADEAKARVEADRDAKVQKQIDAAATTASGVPW
jgi:hypothetical protein